MPFKNYFQKCICSCETALQPSSLLTFIISKFRSDLTPLWTTFRCNNILCFSRNDHDLSKSTFVVAIRSISPKKQLIGWERIPSTIFDSIHHLKQCISSNSASNDNKGLYYIAFFNNCSWPFYICILCCHKINSVKYTAVIVKTPSIHPQCVCTLL